MKNFKAFELHHLARAGNQEAYALAGKKLLEIEVHAISIPKPKFNGSQHLQEVSNFLETRECPAEMKKGQKQWLIRKATRYIMVNDELYCKGKDLVLRRVPTKEEIPLIISSCHDGTCGGHFAHDLTTKKILQYGFVWPSFQPNV